MAVLILGFVFFHTGPAGLSGLVLEQARKMAPRGEVAFAEAADQPGRLERVPAGNGLYYMFAVSNEDLQLGVRQPVRGGRSRCPAYVGLLQFYIEFGRADVRPAAT